MAGLVQASDGGFYGTTYDGEGTGTIFRVDGSGGFAVLHSFTGSVDGFPTAGLVQGSDGRLYGTTRGISIDRENGRPDGGTVFRIDTSGAFLTLHTFSGSDGAVPSAALVQGSTGNFYGTTAEGGSNGFGTVFQINGSGLLTTVHDFTGPEGASPTAGLTQLTDGRLCGTTSAGGPYNGGVIFCVTPPPNTSAGANVSVEDISSSTGITFSAVSSAGTTTVTPVDPNTAGQVPGGFALSETVAYQISTTATFSGAVVIAFLVPDAISEAEFNSLIVLHNDHGTLVDVTATSPARNYATRTLYAVTTSFSPFYLARKGEHIGTLFDVTKAYKSGSTAPIKLRLLNAVNTNVSAASTSITVRSLTRIGGNTSAAVVDSGAANPDNSFRYDAALGGYIFNLSTKGLSPGTWVLSLYAGADRSYTYLVRFEVK